MITIDSKLDMFKRIVLDKSEEKLKQKIAELDKEDEVVLENYKKELNDHAEKFYKETIEKAQKERKRLISKARIEKNKNVLVTRKEMIDEVTNLIIQKAKSSIGSQEYSDKIIEMFREIEKEIRPYEGIIVEITKNDLDSNLELFKSSIKKIGYRGKVDYVASDEDIIGGFIIYNADKSHKFDFSYKSLIDDNISRIGGIIYELLDKVGEKLG